MGKVQGWCSKLRVSQWWVTVGGDSQSKVRSSFGCGRCLGGYSKVDPQKDCVLASVCLLVLTMHLAVAGG